MIDLLSGCCIRSRSNTSIKSTHFRYVRNVMDKWNLFYIIKICDTFVIAFNLCIFTINDTNYEKPHMISVKCRFLLCTSIIIPCIKSNENTTGGGRCNVMHNPMKSPNEIAKGYPRGSKELLGPLSSKFGPWETYDWFSTKGIDLKTEKDGRVFPTTDRSIFKIAYHVLYCITLLKLLYFESY